MIAVIVSPMRRDGLWTLAARRICPHHRDFSVIARLSLRNLQFCLIKRKICISKALERSFEARNRGAARHPAEFPLVVTSKAKTRSRAAVPAGSPVPSGWLPLDRVNVDRAQATHAQHIHLERAIDPVAIKRPDQIVDAVHLNTVQLDHDIARQ